MRRPRSSPKRADGALHLIMASLHPRLGIALFYTARFLRSVLTAHVIVVLCACSNRDPEVLGRWVDESGKNSFEFLDDHTVAINEPMLGTQSGTWVVLGDGRVKVDVSIMGSALVGLGFIDADGLHLGFGPDNSSGRLDMIRESQAERLREGENLVHHLRRVVPGQLDYDEIETILRNGASPNMAPDGRTALTIAVQIGDSRLARVLLDAGSEVNQPGSLEKFALPLLVQETLVQELASDPDRIFTEVLQEASQVALQRDVTLVGAFVQAFEMRDPDARLTRYFRNEEAGITRRSSNQDIADYLSTAVLTPRFTPLMIAALSGNVDLAKLLLRNGADPSVVINGFDAFRLARLSNHVAILELLQ